MSKLAVMINSLAKASLTGKEISIDNSTYNREILNTLLDAGWIMSYSVDQTSLLKTNKGLTALGLAKPVQAQASERLDDIKSYRKLKLRLKQGYFDTSISSTSGLGLKIKQLSKPSKRVYKSVKELSFWRSNTTGHHTVVVTTPKGVMTIDQAIALNQGGEVLFSISK